MDKDNKTKSALAKKIGSSRTWIIKFLREMTEKKYVRDFEVINPKAIFDLFHLLQNKKRTVRSYSIADTPAFLNWMIMTKVKREYAFTTYQAENMVQQYLFPHKIEFYVKKEDVEAIIKRYSSPNNFPKLFKRFLPLVKRLEQKLLISD